MITQTSIIPVHLAEIVPFTQKYQQHQTDAAMQRHGELAQAGHRPMETQSLVCDDEIQLHHADDATSAAPLTPRPTRINHELRRRETFCCHHWWPGHFCHYGNHTLMAK